MDRAILTANSDRANELVEALLAVIGSDADRPCWGEEEWLILQRRRTANEVQPPEDVWYCLAAALPDGPLREAECRAVCGLARLTDLQRRVLRRRIFFGQSFDIIGAGEKTTRQAALKAFNAALRKLRRAAAAYPYWGLADVYQHEIRR